MANRFVLGAIAPCALDLLHKLFLILVLAFVGACNEASATPDENSGQLPLCPAHAFDGKTGTFAGKVIEVVDGDTVDVVISGCVQRIGLLGVDTPETFSENKPNEYGSITDIACLDRWGEQATEAVMTALEGKDVEVRLDANAPVYDSFGRVLGYVYQGGEDVNRTLLETGLARVYREGDSSRISDYVPIEERARAEGQGLWECEEGALEGGNAASSPDLESCDPSYPDFCIPSPPPDLDCVDIPYAGFTVQGDDPHRFDMDGNGIGCEG